MEKHRSILRNAGILLGCAIILGTGGCSSDASRATESERVAEVAAPVAAPKVVDPDHASPTELVVQWSSPVYNTAIPADATIVAEVRNNNPEALTANLVLVASGLDGRMVERKLTQVTVSGDQSLTVSFAPEDIPLQSDASTAFVVLQAEYTSQGIDKRVPSSPLYYRFGAGYGDVTLRPVEEVGITADDGSPAKDGAPIQGRVFSNGAMTDAVPEVDADGIVYGQTGFAARAADAAEPVFAMSAPHRIDSLVSVKACSTWRVQYIDSGYGEDTFTTTAWQDTPAYLAHAVLLTVPGNALVWQGQLDVSGCMPNSVDVAPGTYRLQQSTTSVGDYGYYFNNYYMSGGTEYGYEVWANFTTPASGTYNVTVHPTFNNDAVQSAAVTSLIVAEHLVGSIFGAPLGVVPGTYKMHANEGCPGVVPPTDSCYDPSVDLVHLGTTVTNGYMDAHWKFVIAHEVGHYVQARAMGFEFFDYNDTASQIECQCTYPTSWGNTVHCLQSREEQGGSEIEGFGHAFATRIFNGGGQTNATFVYYKPFRQDSGVYLYPPFGRDAYNPQQWMNSHCSSAGRGVEWDWLTFYTNVSSTSSSNATQFDELFDVYRQACTGSTSTNCNSQHVLWSSLDASASTYYGGALDLRYIRFRDTGIAHGVNH